MLALFEYIFGLNIRFQKDPNAVDYEGLNKELHIIITAMANMLDMNWGDKTELPDEEKAYVNDQYNKAVEIIRSGKDFSKLTDIQAIIYAHQYFQQNKEIMTKTELQDKLKEILNPLIFSKMLDTGTLPNIMFQKDAKPVTKRWVMSALFEMFDVVVERRALREFIRKSSQPSIQSIRSIISAA
jgi:hypothetical protein